MLNFRCRRCGITAKMSSVGTSVTGRGRNSCNSLNFKSKSKNDLCQSPAPNLRLSIVVSGPSCKSMDAAFNLQPWSARESRIKRWLDVPVTASQAPKFEYKYMSIRNAPRKKCLRQNLIVMLLGIRAWLNPLFFSRAQSKWSSSFIHPQTTTAATSLLRKRPSLSLDLPRNIFLYTNSSS